MQMCVYAVRRLASKCPVFLDETTALCSVPTRGTSASRLVQELRAMSSARFVRTHERTASLFLGALCAAAFGTAAMAQQPTAVPPPLTLQSALRIATERRDEIRAARLRIRAAESRPRVVSALDDPMIAPSVDHKPFMMSGASVSLTLEQQFPLSHVRGHRWAAALADLARVTATGERMTLDVELQAATAFFMLQERRRTASLLMQQIAFAREVVGAANARYAVGTASQSDVLRAELEVARLEASSLAIVSEVRGAEAMLNTSMAADADAAVPPLEPLILVDSVPSWNTVVSALTHRPEITAGLAEIARSDAEVLVMRDMYRPMATVRTGPASTMAEGRGWMAMVGLSLPIWRAKLRAGVSEAEAMRAMSIADVQAMRRMIEGDAANALSQLGAWRDRRRSLRNDVLPRAQMAIEPVIASYAAGRLPLVSVIEAVQALWSVQAALITAEAEEGLAWARLGRAIGSYEALRR